MHTQQINWPYFTFVVFLAMGSTRADGCLHSCKVLLMPWARTCATALEEI